MAYIHRWGDLGAHEAFLFSLLGTLSLLLPLFLSHNLTTTKKHTLQSSDSELLSWDIEVLNGEVKEWQDHTHQ